MKLAQTTYIQMLHVAQDNFARLHFVKNKGYKGLAGSAGTLIPPDTEQLEIAAMTKQDLPSIDVLRKIFCYDPQSGKIFWKERPINQFASVVSWKIANKKFFGKEAGYLENNGYLRIKVFGRRMQAHRIAWAVFYGNWPDGEIDHIDGNRQNNKIENLRNVSRENNMANKKIYTNNSSGIVGVYLDGKTKKWCAEIARKNKRYHLGVFDKKEDAAHARKVAEMKFGFHENHGRT